MGQYNFQKILPTLGGLISKRSAYQYLPDSVIEFPSQEEFSRMMGEAGFQRLQYVDQTFGIATVYVGDKR